MANGIGGGISAGDAVWTITGDTSGLNQSLAQAEGAVNASTTNMASSMQKVGAGMTLVGGAITGAFGMAVSSTLDFRSKMTEVATLGVQDMAAMENSVRGLSKVYGLDLVDAAGAAYQTISAGAKEGADADKAMTLAAQAATAGYVDLTTSVGLGLGMVNAFGTGVAGMEEVLGQTFVAIKAGVTTFGELSASIGQVSAIWSAAKLGTDELYASIATLTKQNINTAQAMTSLKAMIAGVAQGATTGSEAADMMAAELEKTGMSAKDAAEQVKPLAENFNLAGLESMGLAGFLQMLQEQTGGNVEVLKKLFGSMEAVTAVIALFAEEGNMYKDILAQMGDGTKTFAEALAIAMEDPKKKMEILKAELMDITVKIGDVLIPVILRLMNDVIFPITEAIIAWTSEHPKLFNGMVMVAAGAGAILLAFGPLLIILGTLIKSFVAVKAAIVGAGAASTVAGAEVAAAGAAATVGGAGFLAGAVGIGAIGIAAIALAPLLHGLAMAFINLREAHDQQAASTEALKKKEDEYIASVKARGVVLDEAAMKEMSEAQKRMYIRQQEDAHEDVQLRAFLARYLQRTETEAEYAKAKNLMLNENISREEAAYAVASGMSDKFLKELMQADAARTGSYMEQLGAREMAFAKSGQLEYQSRLEGLRDMTDAEMAAARERTEAFNSSALAVVDNEARATSMIAGLWQSLFDWVKGLFASIGNFFTGGGGPPIEARASGGPVNSGQPYLVGEDGPELFVPRGSGTIVPNGASGGGASVTINLGGVSVRSEQDIRNLSERLAEVTARELRAAGAYA